MSDDFKYQLSVKTGAGHDASMLNLRADSADELALAVDEALALSAKIVALQGSLQAAGAVASIAAPQQVASTQATPPPVQPWAGAAPAGAPEVIQDRWGGRWTYGLADAPDLPDGRGKYVRHDWTSQAGKALSAWKDPSVKGAPKQFPAGAVEADIKWIR